MIEFNLLGEILDTIASLSGKYGRWLNVKRKRQCFLIWSVVCLYWIWRDINLQLWSQGFFCLFSLGLNLYGYVYWGREKASS